MLIIIIGSYNNNQNNNSDDFNNNNNDNYNFDNYNNKCLIGAWKFFLANFEHPTNRPFNQQTHLRPHRQGRLISNNFYIIVIENTKIIMKLEYQKELIEAQRKRIRDQVN